MATTLTPPADVLDTSALLGEELLGGSVPPNGPQIHPEDEQGPIAVSLRPLLVAGFAMVGTALTVGGIFGSWSARLLCVVAAAAGVGWSWVCARSRRRTALNALLPVIALGAAVISLTLGSDGGPAELPSLVRDAIDAGRALRPPIPFDAGWRPILIVVMMLLGFAAGSAGTVLDRPRLALVIPLPLLGLTAISQPPTGQALAGLLAVVPVIGGLTVLFGDQGGVSGLTREFEFRRIAKAGGYMGGILAVIIVLNTVGAGLLFPEPAYDPAQKPQKPKPIPLNAADDRVLFEVSGPITGPWKVGSLDDYDGTAWRLPPFDPKTFKQVPADGVIDKTRRGDIAVKFTIRDFGTNASLPGVTGPTRIEVRNKVVFDPRGGSFRVPTGRVPPGLTYTEYLPTYPESEALRGASASADVDKVYKRIPKAPSAVRTLLEEAPVGHWDRLDYVLKQLTAVGVAVGTGAPKDIKPAKVQDLLVGSHEGSPYELVAAQAMLARWAGVPSRIGFGFDGANKEGEVLTVRPANASQWLEVYFEGHGWIPIVTQPPKAKATLDNDDARFNPTIQAGDDVAVQIYVPVKVKSFKALYQQIRDVITTLLPILLVLIAARLALPWGQKTWRRTKRQRWARQAGPAAQIAVEYCEWRDLATDLGVGDPFATPIEFLNFVVEDDDHEEFAWLVTKTLYGELYDMSGPHDVAAARELGDSLRARLLKAQPFQTRVLSYLTRLSLQQPYSTEVPN